MSDFSLSKRSDDHWSTPHDFYEKLDKEFHFNYDPCPLYKQQRFEEDWGMRTFMNPPYSQPTPWVKKAYQESLKGKLVVGLLRGDTSTKWFHDWVYRKAKLRFIKGRLRFGDQNKPAPFASIIAIWDGRKGDKP